MAENLDLVIVGGGVAGLTLAQRLVTSGKQIAVCEAGELGGLICTKHTLGFTCEQGPNVLVEKPAILDLLKQLNLQDSIVYPAASKYAQYIHADGQLKAAPKSFPAMIKTDLLSFSEKLSILFGMFKSRAVLFPEEDVSVLNFWKDLLGERAVLEIMDAALKGIYGGSVKMLSARSLFPDLWASTKQGSSVFQYMRKRPKRGSIFVLRQGAVSLIQALLKKLESQVGIHKQAVVSIVKSDSGFFEVRLADGQILRSQRVCLTTAGSASAALLSDLSPEVATQLNNLPFAPLSVVHCAVPRVALKLADTFGAVFPAGRNDNLLGIMTNSLLFPHVAPADRALLTVCLGGYPSDELDRHSTAAQRAVAAINDIFEIEQVEVLHSKFWPRAIPQMLLGHYKVVQSLRALEQNQKGLYFLGTDLGGVGVPDRVQMAYALADRIIGEM